MGEALGSSFFSSLLPLHLPIPAAAAANALVPTSVSGTWSSRRLSPLRCVSSLAACNAADTRRCRCTSMPHLSPLTCSAAGPEASLSAAAAAAAAAVAAGLAVSPAAASSCCNGTKPIAGGQSSRSGRGSVSCQGTAAQTSPDSFLTATVADGTPKEAEIAAATEDEKCQEECSGNRSLAASATARLLGQRIAGLCRLIETCAAVAAASTAAEVTKCVSSLPFGRGLSGVPKWPWEGIDALPDMAAVEKRTDGEVHNREEEESEQQQQPATVGSRPRLKFLEDSRCFLCWCSNTTARNYGSISNSSSCSGDSSSNSNFNGYIEGALSCSRDRLSAHSWSCATGCLSHPGGNCCTSKGSCGCSRRRLESSSTDSSSYRNWDSCSSNPCEASSPPLSLRRKRYKAKTRSLLQSLGVPTGMLQRRDSSSSCCSRLSSRRGSSMPIEMAHLGTVGDIWVHQVPQIASPHPVVCSPFDAIGSTTATAAVGVAPTTPAALAGATAAAATLAMQEAAAAGKGATVLCEAGSTLPPLQQVPPQRPVQPLQQQLQQQLQQVVQASLGDLCNAEAPREREPHLHIPRRVAFALQWLQTLTAASVPNNNNSSNNFAALAGVGCLASIWAGSQQIEQQQEPLSYVCTLGQQELHLLHYTAAAEELLRRLRAATQGPLLRRQALLALAVAVRGSAPPSPSPSVGQQLLHLPHTCGDPSYNRYNNSSTPSCSSSRADFAAATGGVDWICCSCKGARPLPSCCCICHSASNPRHIPGCNSQQALLVLQTASTSSTGTSSNHAAGSGQTHSSSVSDIRSHQQQHGGDSYTCPVRCLKSSPCISELHSNSSSSGRLRGSRNEAGEELLRERRLLQLLFLSFDQDGDGLLSYRDFADGMLSLLLLAAILGQLSLQAEEDTAQDKAAAALGVGAPPQQLGQQQQERQQQHPQRQDTQQQGEEQQQTEEAVQQQQQDSQLQDEDAWVSWVSRWLLLHFELLLLGAEIDGDGSGAIELSEFLAATLDSSLLASQPSLRKWARGLWCCCSRCLVAAAARAVTALSCCPCIGLLPLKILPLFFLGCAPSSVIVFVWSYPP